LISSLAAMLQVSLRRSRASWPIVGSAGLICVLATTLMAAGPMYASAVSAAGLHRVLADAQVAGANVGVTLRTRPADWEAIDALMTQELGRAVGPVGGAVVGYGRSDSFELPGPPSGPLVDLAELGFIDGLVEHAELVEGVWPEGDGGSGPLLLAIADSVAARLDLPVGHEFMLQSRATAGFSVPVRIDAIFRIADPNDRFWWDEPQVLDGLATSQRFATHGPLFTSRSAFLARANAGQAEFGWRTYPTVEAITLADIAGLRARVAALDDRLEARLAGPSVTVETGLPDILAESERSLLVSRTGVLLLTAQFVVLAAYAVLLSAALLVEHRRMDTAMLRSRGAGPARIGALALVEGLLLTIPAALLGPWLAAAALRGLNVVGPLADIGLYVEPVVSPEAFVASAVAAGACLLALLVPALPRIRSFAAIHGSMGRAETRTVGQRFGIDVALLAVAGIGLWQLRQYGAPLTRTVQGTLGIDPLLVATPAIGFLAGAVVALRVVPLIASVIERATARRRSLVPALGARQLARRPLRYTRAALLLMLAMSMGVFAITYTRTWSESQHDQATFQVGSDVRVEPGRRIVDLPAWALDRAYAGLPGVTGRMAVTHAAIRVPRIDASGALVGLDAAAAGPVVRMRADLLDGSVAALVEPLAAGRPEVDATRLPGEPGRLRLGVRVDITSLDGPVQDPETGELLTGSVDPALLEGEPGLAARAVVRDAAGHLYRFGGESTTFGSGPRTVEIPLRVADRPDAAFAYPLDLLAIELVFEPPPTLEVTQAAIEIERLEVTDANETAPAGGWQRVDLTLDHGWRSTASVYGLPHQTVGGKVTGATLDLEVPADGFPSVRGQDQFGRGTVLTFAPADLDLVASEPLPAVATDRYLEATARAVGDVVPVDVGGVDRELRIFDAVRAFPSVDPATPALLVDFATLTTLRFEGTGAVDPPDAWWLAVDPVERSAVLARLRDPAFGSAAVEDLEERSHSLATDPVALGIIGALGIGIAAAAAFAVVGFIVSAAVSARERVTEFALLRALGLSSRQLSGWLSLENATLAVISLVAGSALGLLVAWVALPFVTVTSRARAAFPPVEVDVPWTTIAALEVAGIVALTLAIIGLTWSLGRIAMASALRMGED
jgi:FtsX-like permease family